MDRNPSQFYHRAWLATLLVLFAATFAADAQVRRTELSLPTQNRAIFGPDPSQFYMYTNRSFEGRQSRPWQAGKYGYVRNPRRTSSGIVYAKFHEGADIRPVSRDRSGNPLDIVRAISAGKVVHVNPSSSASNYGRYVVVKHDWGYGPFYSLYAHLSTISCKVGQSVRPGTAIAKMGYTGAGLNRTRAHLHLELNMMISPRFQRWYDKHFTSPNRHGNYNGINLAGLDVAGLYLAHRRDPNLSIPQFMARMRVYYKVLIPNKGLPEILRTYPWLGRDMVKAKKNPSWELSLSSSGIPLAVRPSTQSVRTPTVSWVTPSSVSHSWNTRSRLTGSGSSAKLSSSGLRYIQQLAGGF